MIVFPVSFIKAPSSSLFTIATFTDVGTTTWVAPAGVSSIEYLVVGGGGGGANGYDNAGGGGGGGGMVLTGTLTVVPGTSYTVTVGDGGLGGANARANNAGLPGSNSVFSSITSLGGGNGLGSRTGGVAGVAQVGDTSSATGGSGSGGGNGGKGGGGASGAGSTNSGATGGAGGTGTSSSISGSAIVYGAGGAGANAGTQNAGVNGSSNTGNGGRAGGATSGDSTGGGNGGTGIVIIRNLSVTFSQAFVGGVAPLSAVETAWNTFRAALTGNYTSFVWSSTNGSSLTVSDPTKVQTLANNLRNGTAGSVTIGSTLWLVGVGCGTPKIGGTAVEFSNVGSCNAGSTYALRPMINNANWGGTNQSTVNAPSQTITLTFF
jgi:hypothetical protein